MSHKLNADVTREIVLEEVRTNGPIGMCEMYEMLKKVFRKKELNYAVFCSALLSQHNSLCVIEGVIDIVPQGLSPLTRRETKRRNTTKKVRKYAKPKY